MQSAGLLVEAFERNRLIIHAQCEGLTHEDGLLQTPYNINSLNWVIGHILDERNRLILFLGEEPAFPSARSERYRVGSEPVVEDGPDVVPLSELLDGLDASQEQMAAVLGGLSSAALAEIVEDDGDPISLEGRIHFTYFHETYHTGQTELLRQVAGTGDKII